MKYYLMLRSNNTIMSVGTKLWKDKNVQETVIEIPIKFKGEGICKNNWKDIKNWIIKNTEYKFN